MSSHKYTVDEVINFCQSNPIYIVDRLDGKNKRVIREVHMSIDEAINEIRNLRKEFLFQGPFLDKDIKNNYLYEFHKHIRGRWCYIKLTIDDKKNVVVRVISLHESEVVEYAW